MRILVLLTLLCFGCGEAGDTNPVITTLGGTKGTPDEFKVLPRKELQEPPNFSELPTPTPGARNLTDVDPQSDAIRALGGRPGAAVARADQALLTATGADRARPDIREILVEEDAEIRRRNRPLLFERIFGNNPGLLVYRDQLLDAAAEAERLRALGVVVPDTQPPAQ